MRRVYDKSVEGYVFHLSGGPGHKLALPKDASKDRGLGLTQPFVVFQVFVPEGHHASFEIQFSDEQGTRRRLVMSTSFVETKPSPLHCQVPLSPSALPPERWTQLAVHVPSMARALFLDTNASQGTASFRAVEHIGVCAHCRLRRVFTTRAAPAGDETFAGLGDTADGVASMRTPGSDPAVAPVPRAVAFPKDTPHKVSVLVPSRLSRAGKPSSRERGLSSRERGRGLGSSREGARAPAPAPRGGFAAWDAAPPRSPRARGGQPRGISRDGGSRQGSLDVDGRSRAAGMTERWGFDALETSSGDSDVLASEGWQIAFGSRVSTPARGSRPSSRAKESASREVWSRGELRANARTTRDGDRRERERERRRLSLSGSLVRGLSFDDDEPDSRRSKPRAAGSASRDEAPNALGDAVAAMPSSPRARAGTEETASAASDLGGWDFMRDGVLTRARRARAPPPPETRARETDETDAPVDFEDAERPARDPRRTFPDDEWTDDVAFVDGDATRSGDRADDDDSGGWAALRPRRAAGRGGEKSVPGRPPGGDPSALLGRDYRMYTPELVVVSDRREDGNAGKRLRLRTERGNVGREADIEDAGRSRAAFSASASSASSFPRFPRAARLSIEAEPRGAASDEALAGTTDACSENPERKPVGGDRRVDLDLVYDPMLNVYYDPRDGACYELA